jgi:predicted DNA-binding protein
MEALSHRLEIRIEQATARRLREAAERRGLSVGQVVREAITRLIEDDASARKQAADALCGIEAPVADWSALEQEIIAGRFTDGL